jgi:predicted tellurium resistance membrane protein TerC
VELACQRKGQDNITAILLLVPWKPAPVRRASRFWIYLLWGVIALVFMALLIVLGSWLVFDVWLPPSVTPTPPG